MGLYVDVGQLARCVALKDRRAVRDVKRGLKRLNQALKKAGLPEHHEPENLNGKDAWGCKIAGLEPLIPLRRLAARVWTLLVVEESEEFETWPAPGQESGPNGVDDPVFRDYYDEGRMLFDHLMYFDNRSYVVPMELHDAIYSPELGTWICSSEGLKSDCEQIANVINLPTDLDPTSKCFRDATNSAGKLGDGWWNYPLESYACLQLITAARKSIELGSVIAFG